MVNQRIAQGKHDEGTINAIIVFAQQDVSGPTSWAVGVLTLSQSFEDHPEESKRHMDGIVQLVRAAGGPSSPEYSQKTRRHVFL